MPAKNWNGKMEIFSPCLLNYRTLNTWCQHSQIVEGKSKDYNLYKIFGMMRVFEPEMMLQPPLSFIKSNVNF